MWKRMANLDVSSLAVGTAPINSVDEEDILSAVDLEMGFIDIDDEETTTETTNSYEFFF